MGRAITAAGLLGVALVGLGAWAVVTRPSAHVVCAELIQRRPDRPTASARLDRLARGGTLLTLAGSCGDLGRSLARGFAVVRIEREDGLSAALEQIAEAAPRGRVAVIASWTDLDLPAYDRLLGLILDGIAAHVPPRDTLVIARVGDATAWAAGRPCEPGQPTVAAAARSCLGLR